MENKQSQESEAPAEKVEKETRAISNVQSVPRSAPPTVVADDRGLLVGGTFEEQWRIASAYAKSGLVPQVLASPEKVLVAIQFSRELGLQPITAMRQICVINGTPALWGDLPLSLAMKSGLLEDIQEKFDVDAENNPVKAVCTIKRKGVPTPVTRDFSMDDARKAGLTNKDPWKKYPKRMLQCRARAWALKDLFPDMLNGAAIAEYDFGSVPDGEDTIEVINTRRSTLNERFASDPVTKVLTGNPEDETKK